MTVGRTRAASIPRCWHRQQRRVARPLLWVSTIVLTTVSLLLAPLVAGPAMAHDGQNAAVDVEPSHVAPGGVLAVSGSDFVVSSPVELRLRTADGDVVVATAQTGDDGHFYADVALDDNIAPRAYELQAVSGTVSVSTLITVTANPRSDRSRGVAVGAGALGLAVAALWVMRRRAAASGAAMI